ncbi:hypothetical protein Misp01_71730 [Microtetraspora sp. NBRC 13810]|uniref:divisome protein SepX/GlpR n=1 Tax=Microtetraspora sp. NBRC 13810 TaxID=3030990 RepID=UPI0024A2AA8F|nr:hypothetical protein [Microtetraspora sp. NBRC 13810]GLW12045.1 hypothetical protein Misp01_71730 [Microtetraspora sp. NBRC 13810]
MSSAFLYLAIVVMWLCVLVPMWLRRDRSDLVELQEPETPAGDCTGPITLQPVSEPSDASSPASAETSETEDGEGGAEASGDGEATPDPQTETPAPATVTDPRRLHFRRRAVIVARRRRRLFWCALLVLASVVTAAVQVIPWWGVAPSGVLTIAYLSILRVAVRIDRDRSRLAAEARAERARRLRERRRRAEELAAQQQEAEIIALEAHQEEEIFDQYAELPRRAVGD